MVTRLEVTNTLARKELEAVRINGDVILGTLVQDTYWHRNYAHRAIRGADQRLPVGQSQPTAMTFLRVFVCWDARRMPNWEEIADYDIFTTLSRSSTTHEVRTSPWSIVHATDQWRRETESGTARSKVNSLERSAFGVTSISRKSSPIRVKGLHAL